MKKAKLKAENKIRQTISKWKVGDYLRQLSIVILGILITFMGSDAIGRYNQRKEVKKAMRIIRNELKENKKNLEELQSRIALKKQAANFLLKHKSQLTNVPVDSIIKYGNLPLQYTAYLETNDAMEMLKASALMQKIDNPELVIQIIKAYNSIHLTSKQYDIYSSTLEKLQNNLPDPKNSTSLAEVWIYLVTQKEGLELLQKITAIFENEYPFNPTLDRIDYTIELIDKIYN